MNAITPFNFDGHQVRTLTIDGEPWFVATDIAKILGYREAYDLTRSLDPDEKGPQTVRTPGGPQTGNCITEPGLYRAIIQRQAGYVDNPEARESIRRFQRWVIHEVLPEIRKTGSYGQIDVSAVSRKQLALMVLESEERIEQLEARNAELEPAAAAWAGLCDPEGFIELMSAARSLSTDPLIGDRMGGQKIFGYLKEIKWMGQGNFPYQAQINNGRMGQRIKRWMKPNGQVDITCQPLLTMKGLGDLHKRLIAEAPPSQLKLIEGGAA